RRKALLEKASDADFVIIEDDYEAEANFIGNPTPALKSLDKYDRVIYVGSLSKTLSPGLRMGYMVGPEEFIREARALRRLMLRHPPANNQRSVALFLSLGHHDTLVHRQNQVYKERWRIMRESLEKYMPETYELPTFGGSAVWIEGDPRLDATQLSVDARRQELLIEPGEIYFHGDDSPKNYFRLAYSSIDSEFIEPGIRLISEMIRDQLKAG
ncbi:MAG: PLP-dependent aminotransferase family protein, partial [Gammaproteobacteria bacterium]|nr:PLP-dependent aminotransferase family protein [Gammaproteobacteria bacterium]